MKKLSLLVCLIIFFTCRSFSQTATFTITYTGSTTQAETAINYAAAQWGNILVSTVPIKVLVHWMPLVPGLLGITFPNGALNFPGAPMADTWYATSLANSITSTELNPGQVDIEIYLNSSISWYYDTSGTVPGTQYDLVSVAMHELGHGFGLVGLAKKSGSDGSFGLLQASDFFPLTTSFPWPNLDTLPGVWDRYLVNNLSQSLDSFTNPSAALGTQFTGNNIFFDGTNAVLANGGNNPKIYAPATFALGSSMVHLDEATYPNGNPNEMMTPTGSPGTANHSPGPIVLGILKDIGWNLNPTGLLPFSFGEGLGVRLYPNPAKDFARIILPFPSAQVTSCTVTNLKGVNIFSFAGIPSSNLLDVSGLENGVYVLNVFTEEKVFQAKIVKQ